MHFERVAVIGSDYISVSIALGLKAHKEPPEIVGYDTKAVMADLARTRGAFDRVERKPGRACRDADLVIVSVPLTAIRDTFTAIAPHLRPGCLVTDTACLKAPVMRWAEELLQKEVFFASGRPVLKQAAAGPEPPEGLDDASADLLTDALYCFTTSPGASGEVIAALTELAQALEAHPFFIDVAEHDGLQAGVEGLPDLLAIALLRATVDTPGWQEMRKFAGYRFAAATEAIGDADETHERNTAIFLNRENIVRRLDVLLTELVYLRDLLTQDDAEPLEETFAAAAEGRARWLRERGRGEWGRGAIARMDDIPSPGAQIRRMLFGERPARREKEAARPRTK